MELIWNLNSFREFSHNLITSPKIFKFLLRQPAPDHPHHTHSMPYSNFVFNMILLVSFAIHNNSNPSNYRKMRAIDWKFFLEKFISDLSLMHSFSKDCFLSLFVYPTYTDYACISLSIKLCIQLSIYTRDLLPVCLSVFLSVCQTVHILSSLCKYLILILIFNIKCSYLNVYPDGRMSDWVILVWIWKRDVIPILHGVHVLFTKYG